MKEKRYIRKGECNRCGFCCLAEDPPCPHLKIENNIASCLIHNQERPLRCTLYPDAPPLHTDKCGYYFIDTWEDNKIVRRIV